MDKKYSTMNSPARGNDGLCKSGPAIQKSADSSEIDKTGPQGNPSGSVRGTGKKMSGSTNYGSKMKY